MKRLSTGLAIAALVATAVSPAAAAPGHRTGSSRSPQIAAVHRAVQPGVPDRDATLAMRDLAQSLGSLSTAERAEAQHFLARPTDPQDYFFYGNGVPTSSRCYTDFCLTWASQSVDAPPAQDSDADGVPDWVNTTRDTITSVLATYRAAGFRAPMADSGPPSEGSTTQLDIYLTNLADDGLYGFCAPDLDHYDKVAPSYCVFDNDFATSEYGGDPALTLGVTAAHELFHATQFSYDAEEAPWFLESTATWVEDQLYDTSNDNRQYLPYGELGYPSLPLDDYVGPDLTGAHVYGAWIFWRFLSEGLGSKDPLAMVRKALELAGDGPGEPDLDGVSAARRLVEDAGRDWTSTFATFAAYNRVPAAAYSEGATYPAAPALAKFTLSKAKRSTGARKVLLDHLASANIEFLQGPSIRGAWSLTLDVDLPDTASGIAAVVSLHQRNGTVVLKGIPLDKRGVGRLKVSFQYSKISKVALTLVNAGTRYRCDQGTRLNCHGLSLDDRKRFLFAATAKPA